MPESNEWRNEPGNEVCRAQLRAFRDGRLAEWTGLRDCRRVDIEAVFGESEPGSNVLGELGEARDYGAQGVARNGFVVWFEANVATSILASLVELAGRVDQILGSPELERPSQVNAGAREWIYASRGLTFQTSATGSAFSVRGFAPMTVDEFLAGPIGSLRLEPRP